MPHADFEPPSATQELRELAVRGIDGPGMHVRPPSAGSCWQAACKHRRGPAGARGQGAETPSLTRHRLQQSHVSRPLVPPLCPPPRSWTCCPAHSPEHRVGPQFPALATIPSLNCLTGVTLRPEQLHSRASCCRAAAHWARPRPGCLAPQASSKQWQTVARWCSTCWSARPGCVARLAAGPRPLTPPHRAAVKHPSWHALDCLGPQ